MKKRFIAIVLAATIMFTLCACGSKVEPDNETIEQVNDTPTIAPLSASHIPASINPVDGLTSYSEHWFDSTSIHADLTNELGLADSLTISNITTFQKLPLGYDNDALLEWGKDPGLGVDILHQFGYTGSGAAIAYVDQPLAQPLHEEYDDLAHYINTCETDGENSMHGPAVLSLLAGDTIGTAPDAEVYFYAHESWRADQTTHAACLYQIIEQNKTLPASQKITMVGFSDNIDENEKNAQAFRDAVAACEAAGIMVWFCGDYGAAAFVPMSDRSNPENLTWDQWGVGSNPDLVFVPAGSRTTAATTGGAEYIYWSSGGLSWTMPYMLGIYAIAKSIDTTLTQSDLRQLVVDTAYTNTAGMQIVNPVGMIAAVLDNCGKTTEASTLRQASKDAQNYLYAIMDTAAMTEEDLAAAASYLSTIADATVLVADAAAYSDAASLYTALQADHAQRGGTVTGVQIFGTPAMVPAFSVQYRVQMENEADEGGTILSDLFYGNFDNDAALIGTDYNVLDHFANNWNVALTPQWPVARLPLSKGEFAAFFAKYQQFAADTALQKQTLVNFSNPIFAQTNHIDDMSYFLNRLHGEFGVIDDDYLLYGNQQGDYPVTTSVLGDFTADNMAAVNNESIVEFLVNSHGQQDNIDRCIFVNGEEQRQSLMNTTTINSTLDGNPYYLDCWTCNNGYGMANNLTTAALNGQCVGMFSATGIISNIGVDNQAFLSEMQRSNFYYFYYTYLSMLNQGKSRSDSFFAAQQAYAEALLADSTQEMRWSANYQFNLYNLLCYENFGVIEPNIHALALYENSGYIEQAGQSVPKDSVSVGNGGGGMDSLSNGVPIGDSWTVAYRTNKSCPTPELYSIYGLTAQQLDNGMIRMTLDYQVPAGLQADAFDPPNGEHFMVFSRTTTGIRETFVYDLSHENLQQTDTITMMFFGNDIADADMQFLSIHTKDILSGYDKSLRLTHR